MHDSLFYVPGAQLSQPELSAARLDGLVFELGAGYMPADLPEGPSARLRAVAAMMIPGYAASGSTAAWVHGAGDAPPSQHHFQRAVEHRPRVTRMRHVVVHEGLLPSDDLVTIGEIAVSTPLRTLTDLVVGADRYPEYTVWMQRMARITPDLVPLVAERLVARGRAPGRQAARTRLQRLAEDVAQEEVTR
ncbi:type IV toxin-antitoxin system AbiEi family antitoxin [Microbacterium sp.]|uniref:type IV toxin-antitoxin system AbiEi family antitoxin n=1 Tax=Microbacterium sp. TaxID=51671 RepID=UPI002613B0E3|nr:type IV toxin-antitoxin system AbiEi family antitoxin [Microbacterium sp.]